MEFVFTLDEEQKSLYELHQSVWSVVRKTIGDGVCFLFNQVGQLVKVRSRDAKIGREPISLAQGKRYKLQVVISPLIKKNGVLTPIYDGREAIERATSILASNGFEVDSIDGSYLPSIPFGKPGCKELRFLRFLVCAVVRVSNAEKAESAFWQGVGRNKRFGFGMIELQEVAQ